MYNIENKLLTALCCFLIIALLLFQWEHKCIPDPKLNRLCSRDGILRHLDFFEGITVIFVDDLFWFKANISVISEPMNLKQNLAQWLKSSRFGSAQMNQGVMISSQMHDCGVLKLRESKRLKALYQIVLFIHNEKGECNV